MIGANFSSCECSPMFDDKPEFNLYPRKTIIISNKWQGPALGARSYIYCTVLYCTVQNCTVLYCTELYCTVMYCTVPYCTVLYCKKLENLQRTDKQTDKQTENSITEATLIPCGSSGGAGQF